MRQVLWGTWWKGLKGKFREQGLPSCIQSRLKYFRRRSVHSLLWQFIPVRDYSNADFMFAATGFTPLLVNLESMTTKPRVGGSSKKLHPWKVEKSYCTCRYGHHGLFYGLGKTATVAGGQPHMGVALFFYKLRRRNCFHVVKTFWFRLPKGK